MTTIIQLVIVEQGKKVISKEIDALNSILQRLGHDFADAIELISNCKGTLITTGIGKSGYIAMKVSATFASTGTTSMFLHASEAYHGDLGRIKEKDLLLCFTNSGESDELVRLIPFIKRKGNRIISITARKDSTVGRFSDVTIPIGQVEEACSIGLAPTSSTTVMLVLGDALACVVSSNKGFKEEDFALFHPGGSLGKRFLTVKDVMRPLGKVPTVGANVDIKSALEAIIQKKSGSAVVVDQKGILLGIFTDGDFRRQAISGVANFLERKIGESMTNAPVTIKPGIFLYEAAGVFKEKKVDEIPVVDDKGVFLGLLDIQDLISAGVV